LPSIVRLIDTGDSKGEGIVYKPLGEREREGQKRAEKEQRLQQCR
jgi:hypothetical protein